MKSGGQLCSCISLIKCSHSKQKLPYFGIQKNACLVHQFFISLKATMFPHHQVGCNPTKMQINRYNALIVMWFLTILRNSRITNLLEDDVHQIQPASLLQKTSVVIHKSVVDLFSSDLSNLYPNLPYSRELRIWLHSVMIILINSNFV